MTTTAVESAVARHREVLSAVASANGRDGAVDALARLLAVTPEEAAQVLAAPLETFVGESGEQATPDAGHGFTLSPFRDRQDHTDLFHARSADASSATGGEWTTERTEDERRSGLGRIDDESAMWFVAHDADRDALVGLVFGEERAEGDIDVAIWVRPEERGRGYGMQALRQCRRELAAFFPGKNVVVRAPLPSGR